MYQFICMYWITKLNQGLVAFSENGLMIRWWSLGTAWWEKLSRNVVPVQCTKLIFVPPEGLSPNSSRSSIMASIAGHDERVSSQVFNVLLLLQETRYFVYLMNNTSLWCVNLFPSTLQSIGGSLSMHLLASLFSPSPCVAMCLTNYSNSIPIVFSCVFFTLKRTFGNSDLEHPY